MVVGVFGEARGAYSGPAPDLMVLERLLCAYPPFPFNLLSLPLSFILPYLTTVALLLLLLYYYYYYLFVLSPTTGFDLELVSD